MSKKSLALVSVLVLLAAITTHFYYNDGRQFILYGVFTALVALLIYRYFDERLES